MKKHFVSLKYLYLIFYLLICNLNFAEQSAKDSGHKKVSDLVEGQYRNYANNFGAIEISDSEISDYLITEAKRLSYTFIKSIQVTFLDAEMNLLINASRDTLLSKIFEKYNIPSMFEGDIILNLNGFVFTENRNVCFKYREASVSKVPLPRKILEMLLGALLTKSNKINLDLKFALPSNIKDLRIKKGKVVLYVTPERNLSPPTAPLSTPQPEKSKKK